MKVIPGKEAEGAKYRDYFDWEEPVATAPSHRVLAMRRGEKEVFLSLQVCPPEEEAIDLLKVLVCQGRQRRAPNRCEEAVERQLQTAAFLFHGNRNTASTKKQADEEAIKVFADNLRQLLLAPPWARKTSWPSTRASAPAARSSAWTAQGKLLAP